MVISDFLQELIDTQWDVNKGTKEKLKAAATELIDTQWDVNIFIVL